MTDRNEDNLECPYAKTYARTQMPVENNMRKTFCKSLSLANFLTLSIREMINYQWQQKALIWALLSNWALNVCARYARDMRKAWFELPFNF